MGGEFKVLRTFVGDVRVVRRTQSGSSNVLHGQSGGDKRTVRRTLRKIYQNRLELSLVDIVYSGRSANSPRTVRSAGILVKRTVRPCIADGPQYHFRLDQG